MISPLVSCAAAQPNVAAAGSQAAGRVLLIGWERHRYSQAPSKHILCAGSIKLQEISFIILKDPGALPRCLGQPRGLSRRNRSPVKVHSSLYSWGTSRHRPRAHTLTDEAVCFRSQSWSLPGAGGPSPLRVYGALCWGCLGVLGRC